MTRALRLLLAAALVAAPAAALPSAGEQCARDWTIDAGANPAAAALEAVMVSPAAVTLACAETRWSVARPRVAAMPAATRLAYEHPESYRPRVVRRHRPSPRSADGDPPH